MSLNSLKRASDIEISSQLTGNVNIDTPQKVNIDALKLKMIKQEKKDNFKNKAIVVSLFFCLLYTSPSPRDLSTSRMPSSA